MQDPTQPVHAFYDFAGLYSTDGEGGLVNLCPDAADLLAEQVMKAQDGEPGALCELPGCICGDTPDPDLASSFDSVWETPLASPPARVAR